MGLTALAGALCCGLMLDCCASSAPPSGAGLRFGVSEGDQPGESFRKLTVTRKGRQEDAMVLIAPAAIHAPLERRRGPYLLKLLAAQVFNVGDGVQMEVVAVAAAERRLAGRRYFDAGRNASDRAWVPLEFPLELSGAEGEFLEIRVSGGPRGDLVADWLALASVGIEPGRR
jgi:hypothetical protein